MKKLVNDFNKNWIMESYLMTTIKIYYNKISDKMK